MKSLSELPIHIGVESIDDFFNRMRRNARQLDKGETLQPGLRISFEDPADFLREIGQLPVGVDYIPWLIPCDFCRLRRQ